MTMIFLKELPAILNWFNWINRIKRNFCGKCIVLIGINRPANNPGNLVNQIFYLINSENSYLFRINAEPPDKSTPGLVATGAGDVAQF